MMKGKNLNTFSKVCKVWCDVNVLQVVPSVALEFWSWLEKFEYCDGRLTFCTKGLGGNSPGTGFW